MMIDWLLLGLITGSHIPQHTYGGQRTRMEVRGQLLGADPLLLPWAPGENSVSGFFFF